MTRIRALYERYGRLPRWIRVAAAVAWAVCIWWMSSIPADQLPDVPLTTFMQNAIHVGLFVILGGLLFLAWPDPLSRRFAWSAGLSAVFGVVDEIHQAYVPGRVSSLADALSNGFGALLACCVLIWWCAGDRRAARAVPWVAVLALGSVSLATFTDL